MANENAAPRRPKMISGRQRPPERILLYGIEGVGKSTFAAAMPRPVFVDADRSTARLDVKRIGDWNDAENLPPQDYAELVESVRWLRDPSYRGDRMTLALDTADKIEREYIWPEVVRRYKPEKRDAPLPEKVSDIAYFKGYVQALEVWAELLRELDYLQTATGMNVIILAHATAKKVENLAGLDYTAYEPDLYGGKNSSAAELLREWADAVMFASFDDGPRREAGQKDAAGAKGKTGKGFTTGERLLFTVHQGWCMAKNRVGLPEQIPLSWAAYSEGVERFYRGVWSLEETDPSAILRMIDSAARTIRGWPETPPGWYEEKFAPIVRAAGESPDALKQVLAQANEKIARREERRAEALRAVAAPA